VLQLLQLAARVAAAVVPLRRATMLLQQCKVEALQGLQDFIGAAAAKAAQAGKCSS
jgi:hypothetical protein